MKKIIAIVMVVVMMMSSMVFGASAAVKKLDLAFVIDTTGSMSDDIYTVKCNMKTYLDDLEETGMDFRIAIIDYRDFYENTGYSSDYPYKVQLDFSSNYDSIISAIDSLYAAGGGDTPETICSALIDGVDELSWRADAGKAVILMGDAPAHDPEPVTGYTKAQAVSKLKYDSLAYEEELLTSSLSTQASTRSAITVFAIATSSNSSTVSDFEYFSQQTGGQYYSATNSLAVSDSIEDIIELIPETIKAPTFWDKLLNFFRNIWYIISFQCDKVSF